MPKTNLYAPLTGSRRIFFGNSLWLGDDHLLYVISWFTSESYKRFYYKDIQAVFISENRKGMYVNIFSGIAILVFLLLSIISEDGWMIFNLVVAVAFFLSFLVNWMLGPTCDCHIQTMAQTGRLTSPSRVRKSKTMMDRLRPIIIDAQKNLNTDVKNAGTQSSTML